MDIASSSAYKAMVLEHLELYGELSGVSISYRAWLLSESYVAVFPEQKPHLTEKGKALQARLIAEGLVELRMQLDAAMRAYQETLAEMVAPSNTKDCEAIRNKVRAHLDTISTSTAMLTSLLRCGAC